jgi:hypothetical protein
MKKYVQLKDGVVYAQHESENPVDTSAEHIIEVEEGSESYLLKRYVNGEFLDPQKIKWAVLDSANDDTVISIESTNFSSEVDGPIITDENVKVLWKWNGTEFIAPVTVMSVEIAPVVVLDQTVGLSDEEIALTPSTNPDVPKQ